MGSLLAILTHCMNEVESLMGHRTAQEHSQKQKRL